MMADILFGKGLKALKLISYVDLLREDIEGGNPFNFFLWRPPRWVAER